MASSTTDVDRSNPSLELSFLSSTYTIVQLSRSESIPQEIVQALINPSSDQSFVSITRTPFEISLILPTPLYETIFKSDNLIKPTAEQGPYVCLKIKGPMDLSLTGILHAMCGPLRKAEIPIFASSTWDTDYVLIEEQYKEQARKTLSGDGWKFATR